MRLKAVAVLLIIEALACSTSAQSPTKDIPLFAHEDTLRSHVVNHVMPAYPDDALRRGIEGLAVALVTFDADGQVVKVKILKAPGQSVADAVADTLTHWTLEPWSGMDRRSQQGTLRFSFSIKDGRGSVEYGPIDGLCQSMGRVMPDRTIRQEMLEDIDSSCSHND